MKRQPICFGALARNPRETSGLAFQSAHISAWGAVRTTPYTQFAVRTTNGALRTTHGGRDAPVVNPPSTVQM
jgi:hypothetical protein